MSIKINGTELGSSIDLSNTALSEIIFNGVTVWKSFSGPTWDNRGLNYNSWETIQYYIQNGLFSYVASVGDTKSFKLNGKTYYAEVVAINDGTGSARNWYPNKTVDFITKELYETTYPYNSANTNEGGFPSSEVRGTLVNTIYPLLPSDLKNVIISKSHSYNISTSGTMSTDSTKLWLPTQYEIFGATDQYAPGETSSNNKKYTLASLIKKINGQTSADIWWLGSLSTQIEASFYAVGNNGRMAKSIANHSWSVPVCFRIG